MLEVGLKEVFGTVWTGILGVLWWDIRGIRKERDTFKDEIKEEYLTEHTHGLMCDNVAKQFTINLMGAKDEIIQAIKDNGACGNCDTGRDLSHPEK
jgi:hypothetical protein